ncbi:SDR family oxidoreductase [Cellulomonas septica]|uniref:SDR family oxidoreductase n=2 Tax=Cellulomonas septica TaxID=285080 RepID=A0ABX1JWY4_9CELL|nr:SDR family oxidoreductase [Cellulomonas septica]
MDHQPDHGETSYKGADRLAGKRALITGADSGIGRAVALAFAREGADVVLSYLPEEEEDAKETARLVEEAGQRAVHAPGDIQDEQTCVELVETTVRELGGIDVLVNNAAYQMAQEDGLLGITTEQLDRVFKTNLYALFWITKAAVPHMQPGSSIINTSSIQAQQPSPPLLDYATSKAGILNGLGLTVAALGVAAGQVPVVVVGMVLYGVGTGVWDAAMNLEGAAVEQELGRTVMPRYHAGFSFGTVGAAGVSALAALLHVPVAVHVPIAVTVSVVVVAFAVRAFLPAGSEHPHAATDDSAPRGARGALAAWLEPRTLLIGLVVLAAALTEGSANDWVSLAVVDGFDTSHALGALAFGVFVGAMTSMRWFGTALLDRYGRVVVLRLCAVLAIVGLLTFALAGQLWLALVGVIAWGAGAALGFPVGMSAASDDPLRAAPRVSVVSTIGYSAFLAGPPLLGLLAQHVGYRNALLVILVPVVLGLLVVNAAAPLPRPSAAQAGDAVEPADAKRPDAAV